MTNFKSMSKAKGKMPNEKSIFNRAYLLAWLMTFSVTPVHAQTKIEVTPMITVNETYDDNLNLSKTNKVSDFVTVVTPGVAMNLLREHTSLKLNYAPSFTWYAEGKYQNYTAQSAGLSFDQDLAEKLRFNLTDTFLESEDPLQDPQNLQGIRQTRNKYRTNIGNASLGYKFGPRNQVNVGYTNNYYKNNEITLDNGTVQNPYANLTYWFDVKNGTELTYGYTDAKYTRGDNGLASLSDYTSNAAGIRYLRGFNPNSTGYVGYNYTTFNYERVLPQDFNVHQGFAGLDHSFSPEYTVSASVGYFLQVNELTDNQGGPTFTAYLTRKFSRGSVTVGGNGGWSYENLQQGAGLTTGFSKYYGGYASGTYELFERVTVYGGLSYRQDKYTLDRADYIRGNFGARWDFLRYFFMALDYSYVQRNEDLGVDEYTDNRIMLSIGASKLYRW
jgi:hypothetical protein